jgi:tRNA (mo5U34)-methyltransferase
MIADSSAGPQQAELDQFDWWHTIAFANGTVSKGGKSAEMLMTEAEIVFKYPVRGKSVADIGAWNGYFTARAAALGASRILAVDHPTWSLPGRGNGFEGFKFVKKYLAPDVEALYRDVMDLRVEDVGQCDVVRFLGVLYHLKHPLFVLEQLARIARERIVIETHLDALDEVRPAAIFYPAAECWNDPSNWWGPNIACVEAMLQTAGFPHIEIVRYPGRCDRAFFHAWKDTAPTGDLGGAPGHEQADRA